MNFRIIVPARDESGHVLMVPLHLHRAGTDENGKDVVLIEYYDEEDNNESETVLFDNPQDSQRFIRDYSLLSAIEFVADHLHLDAETV